MQTDTDRTLGIKSLTCWTFTAFCSCKLTFKSSNSTCDSRNLLVLVLHHVSRVGLFNGFCKEFIQWWHELSGRKTKQKKKFKYLQNGECDCRWELLLCPPNHWPAVWLAGFHVVLVQVPQSSQLITNKTQKSPNYRSKPETCCFLFFLISPPLSPLHYSALY